MGAAHTAETKAKKAALAIAELEGRDFNEVFAELKAKLPVETQDDKIAEAEAATQYFETRGQYFTHLNCRGCGELFAYKWNRHAIKYCSVQCAHDALKKLGLKWDPTRDQTQRWGQTAPIVVPAAALPHLQNLIQSLPLEESDHTDQVVDIC